MANQDQHHGLQGPSDLQPAAAAFAGAARRRFVRRGATAAAAGVLTLKSQPGMATVVCTSPSANASFTIFKSTHPGQLTSCAGGLSPGYYKTHTGNWYSTCQCSTKFDAVFKCYSGNSRSKNLIGKTMLLIVTAESFPAASDPNRVAMHIIAAYQNALKGLTTFLQPGQVIAIWNSYAANGSYKPLGANDSVSWNGAQIVAYLQSTQV